MTRAAQLLLQVRATYVLCSNVVFFMETCKWRYKKLCKPFTFMFLKRWLSPRNVENLHVTELWQCVHAVQSMTREDDCNVLIKTLALFCPIKISVMIHIKGSPIHFPSSHQMTMEKFSGLAILMHNNKCYCTFTEISEKFPSIYEHGQENSGQRNSHSSGLSGSYIFMSIWCNVC